MIEQLTGDVNYLASDSGWGEWRGKSTLLPYRRGKKSKYGVYCPGRSKMSVVHRFTGEDGNFNWEGAIPREYIKSNTRGADGKVVIGRADGARQFIVRYFRVEPGGWTAHEKHPHDHGIVILHGRAQVLLGNREVVVGPRDAVYISPDEVHQLKALGDDPLGFLCIVPPKENEIG